MRIAHIICTFPPYKGGMGNSANNFARILSRLGNEITVFTPDYGGGEAAEKFLFRVERLKPFLKSGNAALLPQIFFKLKNFDIVHLHYPFFGAAEWVLLRKMMDKKMKLVVHYHMDAVGGSFKGFVFKIYKALVLPGLMKRADAVICGSLDYLRNSEAGKYLEKYGTKFEEVPFGVDLERFHPDPGMKKAGNILFVSALDKAHYFKGLDNLLEAFRDVSLPGASLTIIGGGDMEGYYRSKAEELGLGPRVAFLGRAPDEKLIECDREAEVLVLPSVNKGEAFGTVLLEALASGTPVIASNLPGVRSVFHDRVEGFYIEPGDVADLAEKLKKILIDPDLSAKMGKAGRRLAEERYDWGKIGRKVDDLYKKITAD